MKVWKFGLPYAGVADITMPISAKPVAVGWQGEELVLWAAIEDRPDGIDSYRFHVLTTGHSEIPANIDVRYIGTAQLTGPGGQYVVHVFQET
jgi:hypothetical protein